MMCWPDDVCVGQIGQIMSGHIIGQIMCWPDDVCLGQIGQIMSGHIIGQIMYVVPDDWPDDVCLGQTIGQMIGQSMSQLNSTQRSIVREHPASKPHIVIWGIMLYPSPGN